MQIAKAIGTMNFENFEIKVYESLGVKQFRTLVFRLERFIHRKDHGTNINYHLATSRLDALHKFTKYLFYNGAIHVRNILYFLFYVIARILFGAKLHPMDILLLVLFMKDLYCVMLQRYNFLRIKQRRHRLLQLKQRRIQRKLEEIKNGFWKNYDDAFLMSDLYTIREMKESIINGQAVYINEQVREMLFRLQDAMKGEQNE